MQRRSEDERHVMTTDEKKLKVTIGLQQPLEMAPFGACPLHIPDSTGRVYKTELVLERSAERVVKVNWWHAPDERGPHSHPWPFVSEILDGGYSETRYWIQHGQVRSERKTYRKGDKNYFPAFQLIDGRFGARLFHTVDEVEPGTVTYMVCGRLVGEASDRGYLNLEDGDYTAATKDPAFLERLAAANPHKRVL